MQTTKKRKSVWAVMLIGLAMVLGVFALTACESNDKYTSYKLTFNADGGEYSITDIYSDEETGKAAQPSAADPTKENYDFGGWYTEKNGGGERWSFDTILTADITIYAKWTEAEVDEPIDEPSESFGEFEIGSNYLVEVKAWHETNDSASMMASLLYGESFFQVGESQTIITFYLVSGSIMTQPVSAGDITNVRYHNGSEYLSATSSQYDSFSGVLTVEISVSSVAEYIPIKMDYNGEKTLRLKFIEETIEVSDDAPTFNWLTGSYLIPVAAWHATNDAASMMSPIVYENAFIEINDDGTTTVTIYFIRAAVQPPYGGAVTVEPNSITAFKFQDIGDDEFTEATLTYDALTNVQKAVFTISTTNIAELEYISAQVSYPSNASLRLKLTATGAEIGNEPEFENVTQED